MIYLKDTLHQRLRAALGSGSGTVGGAVASEVRRLRFESSHQQFFREHYFRLTV